MGLALAMLGIRRLRACPCSSRPIRLALAALLAVGLGPRELRAEAPATEGTAAAPADEGLADLEDLLETRVETSIASKVAESVEEAPSIVTVITDVEIRRWGYRSVGEALEHVVGFYLLDDHTIPNLAVRGIGGGLGGESGLIKVMIDGHSVAYRYTGGNWLGVELVPLALVERIEIVRGPASSLYGADAFLGAVNIVTRAPKKTFEGSLAGSIGATGTNAGGRSRRNPSHPRSQAPSALRRHRRPCPPSPWRTAWAASPTKGANT